MSERLLGNFVAIVSGTYTIWLPELVRYSVFLPNRTLGSGRNRLLKIFFCFRTLRSVQKGAEPARMDGSAPFVYIMQSNCRQRAS